MSITQGVSKSHLLDSADSHSIDETTGKGDAFKATQGVVAELRFDPGLPACVLNLFFSSDSPLAGGHRVVAALKGALGVWVSASTEDSSRLKSDG